MPITALPTPPSRSDPTNFATRGDAFLGALPTFATEANLVASQVNASEISAAASASSANAAAIAANATAGVALWVSGTTYTQGTNTYSPINFLTYRRKTNGAGTTDPSLDNTNWQLITGQGDVSTTAANTLTQNLTFNGAGLRLRGDFSSGTLVDRLYFQDFNTNNSTAIGVLPNGTSTTSSLALFNNSVPTNSGLALVQALVGEITIRSDKTGTGTYLPITFYTNGSERMRIDTAGRIGVGSAPSAWNQPTLDIRNLGIYSDGTNCLIANNAYYDGSGWKYKNSNAVAVNQWNANVFYWSTAVSGTAGNAATLVENFRVDGTNGLVLASNSSGLGYGAGSGGTVTQTGPKTTSVTLNKASGLISVSSASLASSTTVVFTVNNSLVSTTDLIIAHRLNLGTAGAYLVWVDSVSSGSFVIGIRNITGGALAETFNIMFGIFKGSAV